MGASEEFFARQAARERVQEEVLAKAARGEYLLIGISSHPYAYDPATGAVGEPVSEAERDAVRDLTAQERIDIGSQALLRYTDGTSDHAFRLCVTDHPEPDATGSDAAGAEESEPANDAGIDDDGWDEDAHAAYLAALAHTDDDGMGAEGQDPVDRARAAVAGLPTADVLAAVDDDHAAERIGAEAGSADTDTVGAEDGDTR